MSTNEHFTVLQCYEMKKKPLNATKLKVQLALVIFYPIKTVWK